MNRRGVTGFIVIGLLLAVVIAIVGSGSDPGAPLDPDNPDPSGTKALRVLIEELGSQVGVADSDPGPADTVLVLSDRLGDDSHERLRRFVAGGGTLVVADPTSPLANPPGSRAVGGGNDCTIEAWQQYDITLVEPPMRPLDPEGGDFCLGTETGAVVTARAEGEGVVISVADAAPFTNRHIGAADNARLAVAALAPSSDTRLVILDPGFAETPIPGTGDESLWDLVPAGVKWGLLQLALAFGLFVIAVGRRHGRPITETPVVELPSSELVSATGTMYERARQPEFAAGILQNDLRRLVAERTGLAPDAAPAALAAAAESRFGISAASLHAALTAPVAQESDLLDLAHDLSRIRQEVLHG